MDRTALTSGRQRPRLSPHHAQSRLYRSRNLRRLPLLRVNRSATDLAVCDSHFIIFRRFVEAALSPREFPNAPFSGLMNFVIRREQGRINLCSKQDCHNACTWHVMCLNEKLKFCSLVCKGAFRVRKACNIGSSRQCPVSRVLARSHFPYTLDTVPRMFARIGGSDQGQEDGKDVSPSLVGFQVYFQFPCVRTTQILDHRDECVLEASR